jgi:hypothetical protein
MIVLQVGIQPDIRDKHYQTENDIETSDILDWRG